MAPTKPPATGPVDGRSVDAFDRALRDASTPTRTRRWLLERAAVGAAGVAAGERRDSCRRCIRKPAPRLDQ